MAASITPEERIQQAEQFVRCDLKGNDSSHDFFHIERFV